jgi:peptidoglycan hydrolase-like protein with peptidoglycan-binding domain
MQATRFAMTALLLCVLGLGSVSALASSIATSKSSGKKQISSSSPRYKKFGRRKASWKSRGQQAIDKARVKQIQSALIRENYLGGEPSGVWDARSKQAMQKYQKERGWQSKVVPDSRALIQLGLGPSHENIINPETAMTPFAIIPSANAASSAASH